MIDVRMISTIPYYFTLEYVHIDFNQWGKEMEFETENCFLQDAAFTSTKTTEITNCWDIIFIN